MRNLINTFYEKNRPAFEIVAVLFILTGVILNLQLPQGVAGYSLKFVQFLLLVASTIGLFSLFRDAIAHFTKPFLGEVMEQMAGGPPDPKTTNAFTFSATLTLAMKRLGLVIIFIFVSLLVLFSLLSYIVLVYPYQSAFIAITAVCYILLVSSLRLIRTIVSIKNRHIRISAVISFNFLYGLLLLGVPFSAYVFLFSGLSLTLRNLLAGVIFSVVFSAVLFLIFVLTRKGRL